MDVDYLKRLAGRKNIPQGIIYKDYVITAILEKISKGPYLNDLIFRPCRKPSIKGKRGRFLKSILS